MSSNYNDLQDIPPQYRPISMWGYFGYQLLFAIPIIGFLFLVVFALSAGNINARNFARSYFCCVIITIIILAIIIGIALSTGTYNEVMNQLQTQL